MTIIQKSIVPILVFAVTISLFTQLRLSFFGLGELLVLGIFLAVFGQPLRKAQLKHFVFTRFWLVYIAICIVGAFVNEMFLTRTTGTYEQSLFDLGAYSFVLLTCFAIEKLILHDEICPRRVLIGLFYFSAIVLGALYFLSFTTDSLFGYSLTYYTHFSPLAINVHQTAMFIVVLPFLGILTMSSHNRVLYRIPAALLVLVTIAMSFAADTTKANMALVVGLSVLTYSHVVRAVGNKFSTPISLVLFAVCITTLSSLDSIGLITEFFQEADPHGARETLYGSSLSVIADSLVFGHGPGPHVFYLGKYWDVHQTQLAVLLQAGVLGLVAFLVLFWTIAKRVAEHPSLLAAFAAILVYSAGGDILRRLPIWVLLVIIYYWPRSGQQPSAGMQTTRTPM